MNDLLVDSVTFSSNFVEKGHPVGVFGRVTNKTSKRLQVNLSFSAESDCDNNLYVFGGGSKVQLDAGRSVLVSISWNVPAEACSGNYTVTLHADTPKKKFSSSSVLAVID